MSSLMVFDMSCAKSVVTADDYSLFDEDTKVDLHKKPIVIIPGVLGSQLDGRLNRTQAVNNCAKVSDWYTIWLDPKQLMPGYIDCWVDDLKLVYDNLTNRAENTPGVQIRVSHFGSTIPFEYLDNSRYNLGKYFAPLVEFLTKNLGYKREIDLFGAAYDWRLSPHQHEKFFYNLELLIEKAYEVNKKKVVVLSHSMGSAFTNYFLNKRSQKWKNAYVDSFVSISGSFFGSLKSLKAVVSGDSEGYEWIVSELKMQKLARTFPSFMYMLPRPNFWPNNETTLIVTPNKNYTVHDYETLFKDIGCSWCWRIWSDSVLKLNDFASPNVPVHCIYSSGLPTYKALDYSTGFPNLSPKFIYGDGDGTINSWSSSACELWRKKQKQPVYGLNLPLNTHVRILWDLKLHKYLTRILVV